MCCFYESTQTKTYLPISSSCPFLHALRQAHPHMLLCVHNKHSDEPAFSHVLLTPVILLHTTMETEFGIQISVLSGGMSVSDWKLFRGGIFCFRHGSVSFNQSVCSHYFH